jgi:hypothetical protein
MEDETLFQVTARSRPFPATFEKAYHSELGSEEI